MSDIRLAVRTFLKQPWMTLAAVVALALGIGLTTTMFSIVNGVAIRGLPFPESDRIVHFAPYNVTKQDDEDMHVHAYAEFKARQRSFEEMAAFLQQTANVVGPDGIPERYRGARVTANMFRLLRIRPMLGRDFLDAESQPGAAPVVIIGEKVWRERFNGAPDAIGQPLRVNGQMMTVVGVMPADFRFPVSHDIWPAFVVDPAVAKPGEGPLLETLGRLKAGVQEEQAAAELATIWNQLEQEYPDRYKGYTSQMGSFISEFVGTEPLAMLLTMLASVFGVLLIACANVANLTLARAAQRTREIAVRTALGAGRGRVIRQLLLEVLLLAIVGAVAGLGIAQAGIVLFNRGIADTNPPFWIDIRIDGMVMLFATSATILAALLAGIVPALRASRTDLVSVMNDEGRGVSSLRMGRFSKGLVIVEMALSFGLLVGSGLMIQSIVNMSNVDFGFATGDVLGARVVLNDQDYPSEDRRRQFTETMLGRLRELPGVVDVAMASGVPIGGPRYSVKIAGRQYANDKEYATAHGVLASPRYFETLRVRVNGREFDGRDGVSGMPTVIVNESFERRYFPRGALGQQLALTTGTHQEWRTVIGVVPNLGMGRAPGDRLLDAIYLPIAQVPAPGMTLLVRSAGDPLQQAAPLRDLMRTVDPNLPLFEIETVRKSFDDNTWLFKVFGSLFTTFGVASLFLAAVGLYAVMAFSVSRRTQEIGVRMAVGASGSEVLALVLKQGLVQVTAGILLGAGLAALLTSGLHILLFGVNPYDPLVFGGIAVVLAMTGLAACAIPARRASRVDPMTALRYQ